MVIINSSWFVRKLFSIFRLLPLICSSQLLCTVVLGDRWTYLTCTSLSTFTFRGLSALASWTKVTRVVIIGGNDNLYVQGVLLLLLVSVVVVALWMISLLLLMIQYYTYYSFVSSLQKYRTVCWTCILVSLVFRFLYTNIVYISKVLGCIFM